MTVPFALFSLLFAHVSHHICLVAAAASPLIHFLSHLALLVLIPMVMGLLSPRGSQITTTTVAGTGYAMILTRARCLLVLAFFFCFYFDQGIGSRSAAWASRVDVVWVSVCVSSIVGWCYYVLWCCIHVVLYAFCMYPHLLCNANVMISTLQKCFNMRFYPWWDLRVSLG